MQRGASAANVLIDQISDWLMGEALGFTPLPQLVEGAIARVHAAGIPILRFHTAFNVLHPLYHGMGITWKRGQPLEVETYARTVDNPAPQWLASPLKHMIDKRLFSLRRHLQGPEALLDFPLLEDLRKLGATDYFAFVVPFGQSNDGLVGSWVTDRRGGFSSAEIAALMRIERRLAVACRMMIRGQVAENVVTTYLGPNAGRRVLAGQIKRGDGETIPAVIWYSDLRGSTAMAERLGRDDYTNVLNCYFECIGRAVTEAGGEILNFIGDAVLAIFPLADRPNGAKPAAARAFAGAQDAFRRITATNLGRKGQGLPELSFGLALHIGNVMFGNIGIPERLSFSVIGSSVNQVARHGRIDQDAETEFPRQQILCRCIAAGLGAARRPCGPRRGRADRAVRAQGGVRVKQREDPVHASHRSRARHRRRHPRRTCGAHGHAERVLRRRSAFVFLAGEHPSRRIRFRGRAAHACRRARPRHSLLAGRGFPAQSKKRYSRSKNAFGGLPRRACGAALDARGVRRRRRFSNACGDDGTDDGGLARR